MSDTIPHYPVFHNLCQSQIDFNDIWTSTCIPNWQSAPHTQCCITKEAGFSIKYNTGVINTVYDHGGFPVAAASEQKCQLSTVTSLSSLPAFKRPLKSQTISKSFPHQHQDL
jgi:hypothetical protein